MEDQTIEVSLSPLSHTQLPWGLLLSADPSREQIEAYVDRSKVFGFTEKGKVVGVVVLLPHSEDSIEIMNLAVLDELRGKGIGKALLLAAINQAHQLGAKQIEIGTGNSSIAQLALYQKCGFRIVSIDRDFFTRNYPEKIIENGIICRDKIRLLLEP